MSVSNIEEINFYSAMNQLRKTKYVAVGGTFSFVVRTSNPFGNTISDLVWRTPNEIGPTEAEMITAYNEHLILQIDIDAAEAEIESNKVKVQVEVDEFSDLTQNDYVLAFEIHGKLVNTFAKGNSPISSALYSGFVSALVGTTLESIIKSWVTTMTGLSDFSLSTPDTEKQVIMESAINCLQSFVIVGIIKKII